MTFILSEKSIIILVFVTKNFPHETEIPTEKQTQRKLKEKGYYEKVKVNNNGDRQHEKED